MFSTVTVSENDSDSSASGKSVNCGIFVQLSDRLSSAGGYTSIITSGGAVKRDVFSFPTKLLTPSQREQCVKEFIAKLYQLNDGNQNYHINQILYKIAPDRDCIWVLIFCCLWQLGQQLGLLLRGSP